MALENKPYKALESVVGAENISQDPAVLVGYATSGLSLTAQEDSLFSILPEAVVLPANTREVQGIVKVCNRYGVKYKAQCSAFGVWAIPGMEGVVIVDMRRMNRILHIDEKNMFAVIEPFVNGGELQAEAMKRGLYCHIVGAGPSYSPLASSSSFQGIGTTGLTSSTNHRNLFGVEWVLPTGELIKLGSPGTDSGWFSGDGPGPSLRGIMRGFSGAMGGIGIFTKIGYKLHPWPGPKKIKTTGDHPQIRMETPDKFKYYYCYWDSWDEMSDATYKIYDAEIAYAISKIPPDTLGWYLSKTNEEFYEKFDNSKLPIGREHQKGWNTVITGRTTEEFEYKKKVFNKIVEETNGKLLSFTQEEEELLLLAQLISCYVVRLFRNLKNGSGGPNFSQMGPVSLMNKIMTADENCLADYVKPGGKFLDCGSENVWGWSTEGRTLWTESIHFPESKDPESMKNAMEYCMKCQGAITASKGALAFDQRSVAGPLLDLFGPRLCNAQVWIRKIKNAFDPNNSSEHTFYVSPAPGVPPMMPPRE